MVATSPSSLKRPPQSDSLGDMGATTTLSQRLTSENSLKPHTTPAVRKKKTPAAAPTKVTKPARPRAPPSKVDIDRQCGVTLPGGGVCARSLTCKTHSMGAKRSVQGRSQPFDVLLGAYQQHNHVKQAQRSTVSALKREEAEARKNAEVQPLTDRDEVISVLQGVAASQPFPLARPRLLLSSRSRRRYLTLREMLIGSVNEIPPLPSSSSSGLSRSGATPLLTSVMASTGTMLGRCIVFNPSTMSQSVRPARLRMNMAIRTDSSSGAKVGPQADTTFSTSTKN